MADNNEIDNKEQVKGFTKEDAYKNLERVNYWLGNGDSKISFALAFIGILIGILFTSEEITEYVQNSISTIGSFSLKDFKMILSIIFILVFIAMFYFTVKGVIYLLRGLKASFDIEKYKQDKVVLDSKLFWAAISSKKFKDFHSNLSKLSDDELIKDINSQTYINSVICTKKYRNYNIGITNIKWAIILFVVLKIIIIFKL
jgi:hypothetical protein